MRKTAIVAVIIIFIVSTIGLYASMLMTQPDPPPGPGTGTDRNAASDNNELPPYLDGANVRETINAIGQTEVSVEIGDGYFNPTVLRVNPGTTVTWFNTDTAAHRIVSDAGSPGTGLSSGPLNTGDSYTYTFETIGTFKHLCDIHPATMKAVVEVAE